MALLEAPGLLLGTVALLLVSGVVLRVRGVGGLIFFPISLISAGFAGTQRVWFVRVLQGAEKLNGREVSALTRSFIGRFVVLDLVTCIPLVPVFAALAFATHWTNGPHGQRLATFPPEYRIALIAYLIAFDVTMTFVAPALALSFRSTKSALRTGLRMIRQTWPQSAWYVIAPGLTLTAFTITLPPSIIGPWLAIVVSIIGGILGLWFKGAVVAFYVRVHPVEGREGAAFFTN